jgi:alpha-tubulin suppressor-like RCC1 family protein
MLSLNSGSSTKISASEFTSFILKNTSSIFGFGRNNVNKMKLNQKLKQLGDGTTTSRNVPTYSSYFGEGYSQIFPSKEYVFLLSSNRTVFGIGKNNVFLSNLTFFSLAN